MSTHLTRKRPRLNSNADENAQPTPKAARLRDEEFWYSDGSIVLVARNVEFRVYQGILSDHSPVFKDMFSLPQPDDASPSGESCTGDRCPVVHLSDSPEDLRHILRFCMPRSHTSPFVNTAGPSIHIISAAARLGHKYQMFELVKHAAKYLKEFFTTDFDTWMKEYDRFAEGGFGGKSAIEVVNIARLIGEPTLLPTTLLICCSLNGRDLVNGFEREDGSREQLTMDDIGLCLTAQKKLNQRSLRNMFASVHTSTSNNCRTRSACEEIFRWMRVTFGKPRNINLITSLDLFEINFSMLEGYENLCKDCRDHASRLDTFRKRIAWSDLPQLLGIKAQVPSAVVTDTIEGSVNATWPKL